VARVGSMVVALFLLACTRRSELPASEWLAHEGERVLVASLPDMEGGDAGCGCRGTRIAIDDVNRRVLYVAGKSRVWQLGSDAPAPERFTKPSKNESDGEPSAAGGLVAWLRSKGEGVSWGRYADVDLMLRRPDDKGGFTDAAITATGGEKSRVRLLPGGRRVLWTSRVMRIGEYTRDTTVWLGDLQTGAVRALGPVGSAPALVASSDGRLVARLDADEDGCTTCGVLSGGFGSLRIFDTADGSQRLAIEGAIESVTFARSGRKLLMVAGSDLFIHDGQPMSVRGGGAAGLYVLDLASQEVSFRAAEPSQGALTAMQGGLMLYRSADSRLEQWGDDGKRLLSFEDVEDWAPSPDGTAYVRVQLLEDGRRSLVARAMVCK